MATRMLAPAQAAVADQGFVFVRGAQMAALLARFGELSDWDRFARSWDDLALDTYMGDGGRYRRRRHAVYHAGPDGSIVREPHQPHYQSLDYNTLNGGIARWFEPVEPEVGAGRTMTTILKAARDFFEGLSAARNWRVEVHQFRIEARAAERGQPTPEGVHRDGVDYVLVLLVDRVNIVSGTTTVHAVESRSADLSAEASAEAEAERNAAELGSFTLTAPLDAALLDDARVAHGVTPIEPEDPDRPAHRDVLVVTFRDRAEERKGR
jgi:hypothetical protein